MPNVCNWWCKIGPVTEDDINTFHEMLATRKKNREFDPTLSSYVPNILRGIKYAITAVYLENVNGNEQVPYMKVSFFLRQLNQIIQFFLILEFFFSYSFNLMNEKEKNR